MFTKIAKDGEKRFDTSNYEVHTAQKATFSIEDFFS